jgi:site-specific DNA-adenine methylase
MKKNHPTGPLFKWFGSKWLSSKKYPCPEEYDNLFEPFAGSASFALRFWNKKVTIFENNKLLASLWNWLIDEADSKLIMDIPTGLPPYFNIQSLDLSYGQQLLLKHWQRTNNYGNCWTTSPWGHMPGQWTSSTRERVAREVEFVKHWKFEQPTYKEAGFYFIDPPYMYNYKYGSDDFNYVKLVEQISSIPSKSAILACEAICPKTGTVPDYLPFEFFGNRITSRRKKENNHHSKELVYFSEI